MSIPSNNTLLGVGLSIFSTKDNTVLFCENSGPTKASVSPGLTDKTGDGVRKED